MVRHFRLADSPVAEHAANRRSSRDDYFIREVPQEIHGRLGYSGERPKLVGCEVFDLSQAGAYVEPYAPVDADAKLFTLEVNGQYLRARLLFTEGRRLRLEFFTEDLHYINAD